MPRRSGNRQRKNKFLRQAAAGGRGKGGKGAPPMVYEDTRSDLEKELARLTRSATRARGNNRRGLRDLRMM